MTLACRPTRSIHRSIESGWRRSDSCVSRTLGSAAFSIAQAAASPARSLSANDNTAISPGGWRRSTASTISSRVVDVVVSRCMTPLCSCIAPRAAGSENSGSYKRLYDGRAVEAFEPNDHEPAFAWFVGLPAPVILMSHARADGLQQQPHRFAGDRGETLHAQHPRRVGGF